MGLGDRFEVDRLVLDLIPHEPLDPESVELSAALREPACGEFLWVQERCEPGGAAAFVEAGLQFVGRNCTWMVVAGADAFTIAVAGVERLGGSPKYEFFDYQVVRG